MSGWNGRGNDPNNISLSEQKGLLRLSATTSYAFHDGTASLLIRQAPEQDFVIETRMTFVPNADAQFAGLVVYESKNAYLEAGRGFCRRSAECAGDGLFLDRFINGSIQTPRLFQPYKDSDTLYLRLQRRGSVYRFYASPNDAIWQPIGERHSDITPLYVGLFAGQNNGPLVVPAYFDYFQISQIPSQSTTP
jgi:beta-xylosidase